MAKKISIEDIKKKFDSSRWPEIQTGMMVRITQRIKEGKKDRLQRVEGLVIAVKHGHEPGGSITIRRVVEGVGIEWIIPLMTPNIEKIEVLQKSKVRRAKLYYIRERSQKQIRAALKNTLNVAHNDTSPKQATEEDKVKEEVKTE
ncbi:MAG TPA: 50S ribosomal protein L19 [Candidatus Paceibacterota bacterium]|nr:50S ribosomal protein L19 [Candidatus Paceibacterota bacterium]